MKLVPLLVVLMLGGVVLATTAAEAPWALPMNPTNHMTQRFVREYDVLGADGKTPVGKQKWLVVNGTGNCCENHVSVTATGRLVDIAGAVPLFSDDEGRTWKNVLGAGNLLLGAEGSGANAPNGDWVGMTWDPYTGDRVVAYKHVAAEDKWYFSHVALHGPFYDRPWIGVIPGPITAAGQTYPYAVLMRGGWPTTTSYLSLDGLTYALANPGDLSVAQAVTGWLDQPAGVAWADHVQPIASARVAPLPGGGALVGGDRLCGWILVEPDLDMRCFRLPSGSLPGATPRFDSKGRVHLFEQVSGAVRHRMSDDGGRTWTTRLLPTPGSGLTDTAVHGGLDMAVVGVRATVTGPNFSATTKIIVHKVTNLSTPTPTVETLQVGNGDLLFSQGVGAATRMDFMTLGILPDGRVVTTFGDKTHPHPRLAVEQP